MYGEVVRSRIRAFTEVARKRSYTRVNPGSVMSKMINCRGSSLSNEPFVYFEVAYVSEHPTTDATYMQILARVSARKAESGYKSVSM